MDLIIAFMLGHISQGLLLFVVHRFLLVKKDPDIHPVRRRPPRPVPRDTDPHPGALEDGGAGIRPGDVADDWVVR